MKSADSMSASLPAGAQWESLIPISCPWKTGPALVAALGDEGDRLARELVAEDLERVEVGVGPEDVQVPAGDDPLHLVLQPLALGPHLGEPGGEDDGELRAGRHGVTQDRQRLSDEDGHQVQLLLDVRQRLGAGPPRHLGPVRVDEVDRGAALLGPGGDLLGQCRVRPCVGVGGSHDGHPPGAEERVQVDGAERGRPAGDVQSVAPRRCASSHVPPSCRAVVALRLRSVARAASQPRPSPVGLRCRAAGPHRGPRGHSPYMTPCQCRSRPGPDPPRWKGNSVELSGSRPPPLRCVTDVSVFSSDWGLHGHFGRENRHRHRVGPRHRPRRGAGAGGAGSQGRDQRPRRVRPAGRAPTSAPPTRWSRSSRPAAARRWPTTTTSPTSAARRTWWPRRTTRSAGSTSWSTTPASSATR